MFGMAPGWRVKLAQTLGYLSTKGTKMGNDENFDTGALAEGPGEPTVTKVASGSDKAPAGPGAAATSGAQRPGVENPSGPDAAPNPADGKEAPDEADADSYQPPTDARGRELNPWETAPKSAESDDDAESDES